MVDNYEDDLVVIVDGICTCKKCKRKMQLTDVPDYTTDSQVEITAKAYVCLFCETGWFIKE